MKPLRIASFALFALGTAPLAAQGSLATQGEVIAYYGAPAPGLPGVTLGGSSAFSNPVIDEDGVVFFRSALLGAVTSTDDRAFWRGTSAADLELVIRSGDAAPGLPGLTLNSPTSDGLGSGYRLSPSGSTFWGSRLDGPGVSSADDSALFSGFAGALGVVIREGDPAPGTAGAFLDSSFSSPSQQFTGWNRDGRLLFRTDLEGGDVVAGVNDEAWYTGTVGALELLQRTGDVVLNGEVIESLGFVSQMNDAGVILHDATLSQTAGTMPALVTNDKVLFLFVPGFGDLLVAREGDPAPDTSGAEFGNTYFTWSPSVGTNAFNSSGRFLLHSDLVKGDTVVGTNDRALYLGDLGGLTMVLRRGDPAPGTDGDFNTWNNSNTSINNLGTISTQGSLVGGSTSEGDDTGVWIRTGTEFELVLREGDAVPGLAGHTFGSSFGKAMYLNDRDQLLITVSVVETATEVSTETLWSWDPVLGLRLVLMDGDQIEVAPGDTRTVLGWGGVQFNNTGAAALCFNHDGRFVLRVSLSGGDAIVSGQVGSLNGTPPSISIAAGGSQSLHLDAGPAHGGGTYFLLGSVSGTSPGIPLAGQLLPLNFDFYFLHTLNNPNSVPLASSFGTLDADGRATATFTLPAGGFPGVPLSLAHHAFAVFTPTTVDFASEAASLTFVP